MSSTQIPVLATTAYLVTAITWTSFTARPADLCEWYTNMDEATDRAEYLNRQMTVNDRHAYSNIKIEIINH